MANHDDASGGDLKPEVPSRRELMKRGLLIGGAGYVVPMILGSATPASAQISGAGCVTGSTVCSEPIACGPMCGCVESVDGRVACLGGDCEPSACAGDGDCPIGWFCIDTSSWTGGSCTCEAATHFCASACSLIAIDPLTSTSRNHPQWFPGQ